MAGATTAASTLHDFTEPVPSPALASYSCHAGNVVVPLVDGHAAFTRVCEAIVAARHSVWVVIGFLDVNTRLPCPGGRSLTLFEVLGEAKERGVDVRVLFWGASTAHFGGVFAGTDEDRALCVVAPSHRARRAAFGQLTRPHRGECWAEPDCARLVPSSWRGGTRPGRTTRTTATTRRAGSWTRAWSQRCARVQPGSTPQRARATVLTALRARGVSRSCSRVAWG